MRSSTLMDGDVEGQMKRCVTFGGLSEVSLSLLARLRAEATSNHCICLVSGPISTGGFLDREKNLKVLDAAIDFVIDMGQVAVFDQLVFEPHFHRVVETLGRNHWSALVPTFYNPLFASGLIQRLYLLPNWQTSQGAIWERNRAIHYSIPTEVLSSECHPVFMEHAQLATA